MLSIDVSISDSFSGQPTTESINIEIYLESRYFWPHPVAFTKLFLPSNTGSLSLSCSPVRYVHIFKPGLKSVVIATGDQLKLETNCAFRYIYDSYRTRSIPALKRSQKRTTGSETISKSCRDSENLNDYIPPIAIKSKTFPTLIFTPSCIEKFKTHTKISATVEIPSIICSPSFMYELCVRCHDKLEINEAKCQKSGYSILVPKDSIDPEIFRTLSQNKYYLSLIFEITEEGNYSTLSARLSTYNPEGMESYEDLTLNEPCTFTLCL